MNDYLLEIGCEEIPARFMPKLLEDLKQNAEKLLQKYRLENKGVKTMGTYRRLVVMVEALADRQPDIEKELKGPAISANPAAIEGFKKKNQVTDTYEKDGYVHAKKFEAGKPVSETIPAVVQELIATLPLPISMRWGNNEGPFIRPVHWVVSVYGDIVIPLEIFGIKAGKVSRGHRFLGPSHVVTDAEERKKIITDYVKDNIDSALLEENAYLTEWPTPLTGEFPKDYLDIPAEFLVECMKKHQKYFPIYQNGKLANQFIAIADSVTDKNRASILAGYEAVLLARLDDVKFFWEEDQKTTLEALLPKLERVTFQKNLGSMRDKTERIKKLCEWLIKELKFEKHKDAILRTAILCKADLVTHTVYEMGNLQGIAGAIYAAQTEPVEVCQGIREHYNPADKPPQSATGLVVGLADRMDTIAACFANDMIPTGSRDPWGVRQMVGVILAWAYEKKIDIDLSAFVNQAFLGLGKSAQNKEPLMAMFKQRWAWQMEQSNSYDIVQGVLEFHFRSLPETINKIQALSEVRKNHPEGFKVLVDTAVRVGRLAKQSAGEVDTDRVNENLFSHDIEKRCWEIANNLKDPTDLKSVIDLSEPLSEYFEQVLVMDKDEEIRKNRLLFLWKINLLYRQFADFEKIVV